MDDQLCTFSIAPGNNTVVIKKEINIACAIFNNYKDKLDFNECRNSYLFTIAPTPFNANSAYYNLKNIFFFHNHQHSPHSKVKMQSELKIADTCSGAETIFMTPPAIAVIYSLNHRAPTISKNR